MWVSLASADQTNSIEFIERSQLAKIIYNAVYSDKKNVEQILGESNLNIKIFKSEPSDIIIIDPYVLHRSVVKILIFLE
tara:strand:- start:152 stop:388 length:237 start_codon:yes stop_codon:yes gene_type:complete